MTSRETREDFIPSCPMAIPSVTVMVQNSRGVPFAAFTPALAACACRCRAMLQGAASFHVLTTPTKGWLISASVMPMA